MFFGLSSGDLSLLILVSWFVCKWGMEKYNYLTRFVRDVKDLLLNTCSKRFTYELPVHTCIYPPSCTFQQQQQQHFQHPSSFQQPYSFQPCSFQQPSINFEPCSFPPSNTHPSANSHLPPNSHPSSNSHLPQQNDTEHDNTKHSLPKIQSAVNKLLVKNLLNIVSLYAPKYLGQNEATMLKTILSTAVESVFGETFDEPSTAHSFPSNDQPLNNYQTAKKCPSKGSVKKHTGYEFSTQDLVNQVLKNQLGSYMNSANSADIPCTFSVPIQPQTNDSNKGLNEADYDTEDDEVDEVIVVNNNINNDPKDINENESPKSVSI